MKTLTAPLCQALFLFSMLFFDGRLPKENARNCRTLHDKVYGKRSVGSTERRRSGSFLFILKKSHGKKKTKIFIMEAEIILRLRDKEEDYAVEERFSLGRGDRGQPM